jgi:quinol-cytochrome oxidoreductase complex cytochrome b subunit
MTLFRPIKTEGPLIPASDTERRRFPKRFLALHFRPVTVPEPTLRFTLTWGLGGTAVVLVMVQLITGILLKFVYEPSPVSAYASIQALMTTVPFGRLVRNLHHWCAHLLVLVVFLHLLRVFFTGAFHPPRQFNWVIGLGQLGVVLLANFTGYLLPWDQLAYWAVTVSTGMLAYLPWIGPALEDVLVTGNDLSPETLRFFFALHTTVVPVLLIGPDGISFLAHPQSRRPGDSPVTRRSGAPQDSTGANAAQPAAARSRDRPGGPGRGAALFHLRQCSH